MKNPKKKTLRKSPYFNSSVAAQTGDEKKLSDCPDVCHAEKPFCKNTYKLSSSKLSTTTKEKLQSFEKSDDFREKLEEKVLQNKLPAVTKNDSEPVSTKTAKYTPLEEQFLKFKCNYEDAILLIQCGYRYRFFGADAEVASEILNVICHRDHNFMTASIPIYRLHVHVKRLVSRGYKVGVIKQVETAAIKSDSENKSGLFERELKAIYTKSTLVGEDLQLYLEDNDQCISVDTSNTYLMCICEDALNKKQSKIGLLAVDPRTGDLLYDFFDDGPLRSELERRLVHIQPVEIIIPSSLLSSATMNIISSLIYLNKENPVRVEKVDDCKFNYTDCVASLSKFFSSENVDTDKVDILEIYQLPKQIIQCYSVIVTYLESFKLQRILSCASELKRWDENKACMNLNAATIRNLEIFNSSSLSNSERGSLWSVINKTFTKFGARLLKRWLSRPLCDKKMIEERQNVVSKLLHSDSYVVEVLKDLFKNIPDLERGIGSIFHLKCTPQEFYSIASALNRIHFQLYNVRDKINSELHCTALKDMLIEILDSLNDMPQALENINGEAARNGNKSELFHDISMYEQLAITKKNISSIVDQLNEAIIHIATTLNLPSFSYTSVSGQNYLIEVKNSGMKFVPEDWIMISATKYVKRFRSPHVQNLINEISKQNEILDENCKEAWISFLRSFSNSYLKYKKAITKLATLDCLLSFCEVAKKYNLCKPSYTDHFIQLKINNGRNPIISASMDYPTQFVSNSTELQHNGNICQIITGPNMGGKSSYIRQVALICILGQIGSFVPCDFAVLPVLDAVYARIGASDNIYEKESTFLSEVRDVSDIMKQATSNSLIIIDEFGRGTSTYDGSALAYATLLYLIKEVQCFTLFVTHYPVVTELENVLQNRCQNVHMSYLLQKESDVGDYSEILTFLYRVAVGRSSSSYGLNVAKMAGLPNSVVIDAENKSLLTESLTSQFREEKKEFIRIWNSGIVESSVAKLVFTPVFR